MNKVIDSIADWLVVIGAINWGALALGQNLVSMLLQLPVLNMLGSNIIYGAVGIAGVWKLFRMFKKK